jgi:hypothetical protein
MRIERDDVQANCLQNLSLIPKCTEGVGAVSRET